MRPARGELGRDSKLSSKPVNAEQGSFPQPCSSCVLRQTEAYCYTNQEFPEPSSRHSMASSSKRTFDGRAASTTRDSKIRRSSHSTNTTNAVTAPMMEAGSSTTITVQNAVDSMRDSMDVVQRYIDESRGTVESALNPLNGKFIQWDDILLLLPPLNECNQVVHCFFTELTWIMNCVHQERFEAMWAEAQELQEPIPRHRASILCSMIACVDLMAPKSHPVAQLKSKPSLDQRVQRENARLLLESYYQYQDEEESDKFSETYSSGAREDLFQLEAETLYCAYSSTAGLAKRSFHGMGRAIRLAKAAALFEEGVYGTEKWEDDLRRRIAWDLIILDRWNGLGNPRTSELGLQIRLREPVYQPQSYLSFRNSLTNNLARIIDFHQIYPSMDMPQRAAYANNIEQHFREWEQSLPAEVRYDPNNLSINSNNRESFQIAAKACMFHSSYRFALCTLMRPFLMDTNAPPHLRFAALEHARKIIEGMHVLVTLCNCPWISFPPAWNALHLFASATTFATVFLSDSKEQKEKEMWPAEDLDWFASTLFEVVDTFHLVAQGTQHHTARVCKDLLVALCNSRETLKERFQKRGKHSFRASTPNIFVDSSQNMVLDPALRNQQVHSSGNGYHHLEPFQDKSSVVQENSLDSMLDNFPFFDPWEWARLTANLDVESV